MSLIEGTLQGLSPAVPGGESHPRGVPHPPWVDSVFCQSRGSQGRRRGGHLQRGPFRGQRESGSQERIPGLLGGRLAAAGLLPSQCLQTWPRPLPAAVRFLSILLPFFLLPSKLWKPPSRNPPQLNVAPRPVSKPGRDEGRDQQPRPIPALHCKGGSGASPGRVLCLSFLLWETGIICPPQNLHYSPI